MAFKKHGPGTNCCCGECEEYSDEFDGSGTPPSADWQGDRSSFSEGSGVLTASTSDKAIATIVENETDDGQRVTVTLDVDTVSVNDFGGPLLNYVDGSNYFWMDVSLNGASSTIDLYDRSSGSDSLLGQSATFNSSVGAVYDLELCLQESGSNWVLTGLLRNGGVVYAHVVKIVTVKAGLSGGIRSGYTTDVEWDNFYYSSQSATCDACDDNYGTACPALTCANPPPQYMLVTVPDFDSKSCGFASNCNQIGGTYIIPYFDDFQDCNWESSSLGAGECWSRIRVQFSSTEITIGLFESGAGIKSHTWLKSHSYDCPDQVNDTVPWSTSFGSLYCDSPATPGSASVVAL